MGARVKVGLVVLQQRGGDSLTRFRTFRGIGARVIDREALMTDGALDIAFIRRGGCTKNLHKRGSFTGDQKLCAQFFCVSSAVAGCAAAWHEATIEPTCLELTMLLGQFPGKI
jgi:hypothetical protein